MKKYFLLTIAMVFVFGSNKSNAQALIPNQVGDNPSVMASNMLTVSPTGNTGLCWNSAQQKYLISSRLGESMSFDISGPLGADFSITISPWTLDNDPMAYNWMFSTLRSEQGVEVNSEFYPGGMLTWSCNQPTNVYFGGSLSGNYHLFFTIRPIQQGINLFREGTITISCGGQTEVIRIRQNPDL